MENFRCFGPAQTLDLSRGEYRPAPWTIILGENGVGKTTLLQALAALQQDMKYNLLLFTDKFSQMGASGSSTTRQRTTTCSFKRTCRVGDELQASRLEGTTCILGFVGRRDGGSYGGQVLDTQNLVCYGYGASRRMGKMYLPEQHTDDTTASLFSDDVDSINAEGWLMQASYTSRVLFNPSLMPGDKPVGRAPEGSTRAEKPRDQIIEILKALLPDVDDVRFSASEEKIAHPQQWSSTRPMDGCVSNLRQVLGQGENLAGTSEGRRVLEEASIFLEQATLNTAKFAAMTRAAAVDFRDQGE